MNIKYPMCSVDIKCEKKSEYFSLNYYLAN